VFKTCVPQTVKVRKYNIDIEKLKQLLRTSKQQSKLSNKQISEKLNKPLTLVEHWFRKDDCFSIPEEDIWIQLKELLLITTKEFDESIMTFEYRDGVYEKAERCYYDYGIAPTLTTVNTDEKIILTNLYTVDNHLPAALKYQRTEYAKQIRKDYESGKIKERRCNMREYTLRTDGLCNTITTVLKDNYVAVGAAMRGRYNPDGETEQKIEIRKDEVSNAITTVTKDSLVVESFQQ
jgi:hypothetical protein